jgi:hypothetical protein
MRGKVLLVALQKPPTVEPDDHGAAGRAGRGVGREVDVHVDFKG